MMNGNGGSFVHGVYYPPSASSAHSSVSSPLSPQTSPQFSFPSTSPPPPKEKEAKVVSWDEFIKLLPEEHLASGERPQSGSLPDTRFFTPKNPRKEYYLVFNSKGDYIANFVHYYFSMTNLARDKTLQDLMVDGGAVPCSDLLLFPKLSQVNTTLDELINALSDSHKVDIISLPGGKPGVLRKDKWSPITGPYVETSLNLMAGPAMHPSPHYYPTAGHPSMPPPYTTAAVPQPYMGHPAFYQPQGLAHPPNHPGHPHMATGPAGSAPTGHTGYHHSVHPPQHVIFQYSQPMVDMSLYQAAAGLTPFWRHGQ